MDGVVRIACSVPGALSNLCLFPTAPSQKVVRAVAGAVAPVAARKRQVPASVA